MPTVSIDHIAMPTANAERLIEFYKGLGFTKIVAGLNDEDEWRAGPSAMPGCGDICFVWDGTVEECQEWLAAAGVEVILGPSPRKGGRDFGRVPSLSLYARDPDDNLLEWMTYL